MDTLNAYRAAILHVLTEWKEFLQSGPELNMDLVVDRDRDRYLLVEIGWEKGYRIYAPLLHIDIIDGKLWIQHDGTEHGVAPELVAAGVPKEAIILGFRSEPARALSQFAVA
jgi:hypothetical protein